MIRKCMICIVVWFSFAWMSTIPSIAGFKNGFVAADNLSEILKRLGSKQIIDFAIHLKSQRIALSIDNQGEVVNSANNYEGLNSYIVVWEVEDPHRTSRFDEPFMIDSFLGFSFDGNLIYKKGKCGLPFGIQAILWNALGGEQFGESNCYGREHNLTGYDTDENTLALSPGAKFALSFYESQNGNMLIARRLFDGRKEDTIHVKDYPHLSAISDNGEIFLTDAEGNATLYKHNGAQLSFQLPEYGEHLMVSSDGGVLVSCQEELILIKHFKSGQDVRIDLSSDIQSPLLSPNGEMLLFRVDEKAWQVYDTATGRRISLFGEFSSAAFSEDGKKLLLLKEIYDDDDEPLSRWFEMWDMEQQQVQWRTESISLNTLERGTTLQGTQKPILVPQNGNSEMISGLSLSKDGKYLMTMSSSGARLWDVETGNELRAIYFPNDKDCQLSDEWPYLMVKDDFGISVLDLANMRSIEEHEDDWKGSISPFGRFVVEHIDPELRLRRIGHKVEPRSEGVLFGNNKSHPYLMAPADDGKTVIVHSEERLTLWRVDIDRSDPRDEISIGDARLFRLGIQNNVVHAKTSDAILLWKITDDRFGNPMRFEINDDNYKLSATGRYLLSSDDTYHLHNCITGNKLSKIEIPPPNWAESMQSHRYSDAIAFAQHKDLLVLAITEIDTKRAKILKMFEIWDLDRQKKAGEISIAKWNFDEFEKMALNEQINISSLALSGDRLLFGDHIGQIQVWNWKEQRFLSKFGRRWQKGGKQAPSAEVAASDDGRYLATSWGQSLKIWDLYENRISDRLILSEHIDDLAYSPRGELLVRTGWLTTRDDGFYERSHIQLFRMRDIEEIGSWEGDRAAIAPNGKAFMVGVGGHVRVYDHRGNELMNFRKPVEVAAHKQWFRDKTFTVDISADQRWLLTHTVGKFRIHDLKSGKILDQPDLSTFDKPEGGDTPEYPSTLYRAEFSLAGSNLYGAIPKSDSQWLRVVVGFRLRDGRPFGEIFNHLRLIGATEDYVLCTRGTSVRVYDSRLETLKAILEDGGLIMYGSPQQLTIRKDILFAGGDTIHAWDLKTGKRLLTYSQFAENLGTDWDQWAWITPDGRFTANDLDEVPGIYWTLPKAPFTLFAPEVFTSNFFAPSLPFSVISRGTERPHPPVVPFTELNIKRPQVEITAVQPIEKSDRIRVSLKVTKAEEENNPGLGAFDLRLFRDGQLVARRPDPNQSSITPRGAQSLSAWQDRHRLPSTSPDGGYADEIEVSIKTGGSRNVEFSAYVFNEHRVRSDIGKFQYESNIPRKKPPQTIILTVAVTDQAVPYWSLTSPKQSAKAFTEVLLNRIQQRGKRRVYSIHMEPGTGFDPTKSNIRTAILALAGRSDLVSGELRNLPIGLQDKLNPLSADDQLLIYFSGHGINHNDREYYLIPLLEEPPVDLTLTSVGESASKSVISASELSEWLTDLQARQTAIVLDTCHAEAAITSGDFRPAPLGNVGLGQLSYDKGILMLVGAQSDQAALGKNIGMTMLTKALTQSEIIQGTASFTIHDLFKSATVDVPALVKRMDIADSKVQQPRLIEFLRPRLKIESIEM